MMHSHCHYLANFATRNQQNFLLSLIWISYRYLVKRVLLREELTCVHHLYNIKTIAAVHICRNIYVCFAHVERQTPMVSK